MRKKFEEAGKGIDEKVAGILDAKQAERLHQLQLQREGAMALTRPEVIKKLDLSEEQQAKIKKIQEDARPTRPARFRPEPVRRGSPGSASRRCGSSSKRPKKRASPC